MKTLHTKKAANKNLRIMPNLGVVDLGGIGLNENLADKVEGEFKVFAKTMRQGLLAPAAAIGLEVPQYQER